MAKPTYLFSVPDGLKQPAVFADAAKLSIMQTAESLFAVRAIESVSLREIAVKSGNGNNNAVQYHFGSREALVQAIFAWRVWQMEEPRGSMIAQAEAEGNLTDIETLMRLICLPYVALTDAGGRHTYAGFMSRYHLIERPAGMRHAADTRPDISSNLRRIIQLTYEKVGVTTPEVGDYRIALASLVFCNMLVMADNEDLPRKQPEVFAQHIEMGLRMATAALQASIA
jgi:AcrR family transcriptional regulator